jgi:pescadillo
MGREQKKGQAGNAKAYMTRAKALKKLQLSLPEWRRLCIIKGIYPRDPKRKTEGADKTYYLRKDVDFLAHERLIDTIRAQNIHRRKVVRARAKKQLDVLKALVVKSPQANLDHVIVERYPQFRDALAEVDDPLCVVALFATLPATAKVGLAAPRVANCKRLMNEFMNHVVRTHALRRVFVSIKGYYYQAEVDGELITWVTPHRFTQTLPTDVDYSVMLTFLELYECMLNFVNFRLYTRQNLAYPPRIDAEADAAGLEFASVRVDRKGDGAAAAASAPGLSAAAIHAALASAAAAAGTDDESDDEDEGHGKGGGGEAARESDDDKMEDAADAGAPGAEAEADGGDGAEEERELLFGGKTVVIGRETPGLELEFVLKSAGAVRVVRQDDVGSGDGALDGVTHWIIDRPAVTGARVMSVEYVQPQFVFDSINAGVLLPPALYAPGAKLPPHLSPFVGDEEDGGYRPWFKDVIERLKAGDMTVVDDAAVAAYTRAAANGRAAPAAEEGHVLEGRGEGGEESDEEDGEESGEESEEESEGERDGRDGGDGRADAGAAEREKELRIIMMSRKKRKQYNKYAKEEKKSQDRKASLTAKRDRAANEDTQVQKKRRTSTA